MTAYDTWIEENVPPLTDDASLYTVRGKCKEFCERMQTVFPELELQAGFYLDAAWGEEQHWWCKAPDGTIVDPTKHQFPSKGNGLYTFVPTEERPIGKCMNCGGLCYPGAPSSQTCSDSCYDELAASFT